MLKPKSALAMPGGLVVVDFCVSRRPGIDDNVGNSELSGNKGSAANPLKSLTKE